MSPDTAADREIEAWIAGLRRYASVVAKVLIISSIMATAVWISTGSIWRSLGIGLATFCMAMFNTWRRYLEPASLVLFLVLILCACVDSSMIRAYLPAK